MQTTRRSFLWTLAAGAVAAQTASGKVTKFVRYRHGGAVSYGILDGDTIRELRGNLFEKYTETGTRRKLSEVKLLYPVEPPKILAVGLNYKSHLGQRPAPKNPEIFYKPTAALLEPDGNIVIPEGAKNVHYEGEMVIVMGKKAKNISIQDAPRYIFGYTCGNDVSERDWQKGDLQWWRAKGSDTFAPLGPVIAQGLDYSKSRLTTRLNGEVKQTQVISDLLFDPPAVVSFVSRFVTLLPGDVIYTGTPGTTSAMKAGDIVEVEIEGIGTLRNKVTSYADQPKSGGS
jgi:2-keto-4-pentenoate hydratase/2-oxohepta-3-ene-1,7-dioic acid hydratase in catechol pathway